MASVPVAQNAGGKPAEMMPRPEGTFNCPPGLEYLTQIDQMLVHQQIELLEPPETAAAYTLGKGRKEMVLCHSFYPFNPLLYQKAGKVVTGFETQNKYVIKNSLGQQIYFAAEESECCERQCCGPNRGFVIHITDNTGQEVIRITRPFKCCAGCAWCGDAACCSMEVTVEAPPGQIVGRVRQKKSACVPWYTIRDAQDNIVFHVEGPKWCICQTCCCTEDIDFKIMSTDQQHQVGKISKQWAGMVREMFTDADHFGVTFPMDLDVRMKATQLGALFLLEFMIFEQQKNNNH